MQQPHAPAQRAQRILDAVGEAARERACAVSVTVVDAAGHPVAFRRMDGALPGPAEVSTRKARMAALFGTDSGELGEAAASLELTNGGLAGLGGGAVLRDASGSVVGAVGVAGATVEADEELARTGASAGTDPVGTDPAGTGGAAGRNQAGTGPARTDALAGTNPAGTRPAGTGAAG